MERDEQSGSFPRYYGLPHSTSDPNGGPKAWPLVKGKYTIYPGSVNVLDYTACTMPRSFVDPALHRADRGETLDCDGMEISSPTNELEKHIRDIYEPERYRACQLLFKSLGVD